MRRGLGQEKVNDLPQHVVQLNGMHLDGSFLEQSTQSSYDLTRPQIVTPDVVHVMYKGQIIKTGGADLAHELEKKGYEWLTGETVTA